MSARRGLALALAVVVTTTLGCGGKSDKEKFDDRVKETSHNLHCSTDVLLTGTAGDAC